MFKSRNCHHVIYRGMVGNDTTVLCNKDSTWKSKIILVYVLSEQVHWSKLAKYWTVRRRQGVLGLAVARRSGYAGWAWREWNKPEGWGGEIERMIHLAGGCKEISRVEELGGSWETERERVPVGKTEMNWELNVECGRQSGQSPCVRERTSCEEFDWELCR